MALTFWRNLFAGSEYSRAERNLRSVRIALESTSAVDENAPSTKAAASLLAEAEKALQDGQVEHCWHFVNAARRHLTSAQSDADRAMAAQLLLIEADKLSSWRRKGIQALLEGVAVPTPGALREALWLRDDFYENRYHRIDMQREQLRTIVAVAASALVLIALVSGTSATPPDQLLLQSPWEWRVLVIVLAFGVLGASFSAARTITVKDLRTIIPELVLSKWITWARTLLGASLGLASYAFLQSGLLNLGDTGLALAAAIAFVGGFSEQVVLKVISGFAGGDNKPDK